GKRRQVCRERPDWRVLNSNVLETKKLPVGKIPMLAIPDSRFINRIRRTVSGAASTVESLASSGAKNYLSQEPYENVVQDLLTQLCLESREPTASGKPETQAHDEATLGQIRDIFKKSLSRKSEEPGFV